jgi:hypothetical protein
MEAGGKKSRGFFPENARRRIAYNAAAVATLELHKIMVASRRKFKVADKIPDKTPKRKLRDDSGKFTREMCL